MDPSHGILNALPTSNNTNSSDPDHIGIKARPVEVVMSHESDRKGTFEEDTASNKESKGLTTLSHHGTSNSKRVLSDLPNEMILSIIKKLSPNQSVCLGLTAKKFYKLHWAVHGKLSVRPGAKPLRHVFQRNRTCEAINEWMEQRGYRYIFIDELLGVHIAKSFYRRNGWLLCNEGLYKYRPNKPRRDLAKEFVVRAHASTVSSVVL